LLEKVEGAWATGLNLQTGSQLRFQIGGMPASNNVTGCYINLVGDTVTEISEKGVSWYT
jgi:hypothetical protein